jgi:carboxypeptidase family protein
VHYRRLALAISGTILAVAVAACHHSVMVVDNGSKPAGARATISGTLVTPETKQPVAGRQVTATENTSAAKFTAMSNSSGGFTLLVDPGTYHLDVTLEPGEGVLDPPMAIAIGPGEIKSNIQVVVGKAVGTAGR